MFTLKERFNEKLTPELLIELAHRYKYVDAEKTILAFFQQELLALAEALEKETLPHFSTSGASHTKDKKYIRGLNEAAALIRSKAADLN